MMGKKRVFFWFFLNLLPVYAADSGSPLSSFQDIDLFSTGGSDRDFKDSSFLDNKEESKLLDIFFEKEKKKCCTLL